MPAVIRFVCAALFLVVSVLVIFQAGYHLSAQAAGTTLVIAPSQIEPSPATAGESVSISTTISPASKIASPLIATVEQTVRDAQGRVVWKQTWPTEKFPHRKSRTFTDNWAIPASQAAGTYTVKVRVYQDDGTELAQPDTTEFKITGTATTVTPTPTRTPATATPTATTAPVTATATVTTSPASPTATATAAQPTATATATLPSPTPTATATPSPSPMPSSSPTPMPIAPTSTPIAGCPTGQFLAEYYNNKTLTGAPTFTRCEATINADWGYGGPGNGIGIDDFSVRWIGQFSFSSGNVTFTAGADDGIRAWLDQTPLIDGWTDGSVRQYQATVPVTDATHRVKVEYYEHMGKAVAQFGWQTAALVQIAAKPTYYVSPTGSDSNPGTAERPWRNFRHVVAKINDGTIQPGSTVEFGDGTYTEGAQLILRGSGSNGKPITLRAANQHQAHIQWTNSVTNTRLWISGSHLTFDGLRMSSPRVTNPSLSQVNADWLVRGEPLGGGAHHLVFTRCFMEATGAFKNTGLNSTSSTAQWGNGTEFSYNTFLVSGAVIDLVNVYGAHIHHNTMTMSGVSTSSLALQTKGGSRNAQIHDNILRLTGGQAQYGLMLGGGSSWGSNIDYIYDTAGYEGYNHVAYNNVVLMENGASFAWGAIALIGAKDSTAINNVIIGSGAGRAIHMAQAYWNGWKTSDGRAHTTNPAVFNNIIVGAATALSVDTGTDGVIKVDYNLTHNVQNVGRSQAHPRSGDPRFVDPRSNWRLQAGSPAVDNGTSYSAPAMRLDGSASGSHDISLDHYGTTRTGSFEVGVAEYQDS
jgi:hypothetical protein